MRSSSRAPPPSPAVASMTPSRSSTPASTLFTTVPVDAEAAGLVLPIRANIRAWEAEAYAALGEFGLALAAAGEAQRIASELRHPIEPGARRECTRATSS